MVEMTPPASQTRAAADEKLTAKNSAAVEQPQDICYLNNAGQSPLSDKVRKAGICAIQKSPWERQEEDYQLKVRKLFASLINAESEYDIAMMPSTAFAITLAAKNIHIHTHTQTDKGMPRKILLLQDQMCSAVYGWQTVCDGDENLSLDIVDYPTSDRGKSWTELVLDRLGESDDDGGVATSYLAVCLPPLHWADGSKLDLVAIGSRCRARRIPFIVDATQAVGAMPVDVATIQPTMLACSVHKWIRGPSGTSLVYVDKAAQKTWFPLDEHGRSRDHHGKGNSWDASKDEMGPRGYSEDFLQDARKLDSGGKPNPILLPMLASSLEEVCALDLEAAQRELRSLIEPLVKWSQTRGFVLTPGPYAPHLVGLRHPRLTPQQMIETCQALELQEGIVIAVRCGAFRISPYLDNTPADIHRLIQGLERCLPFLVD